MSNELDGKVALITGAGQGVGQGIAFSLADRGAAVAVAGRTLSKCETTRDEISSRGGKAIAVECDVSRLEDLERAVGETVQALGGINILVNNAVSASLGSLLDSEDDNVLQAFAVGPIATLRLMKLCYPYLKQEGGSIINLASTAAKRWDMTNYGVYAAEKEAIRAFIASIPAGRIGDCKEDIGEFVALLCLPGASYVSGQSIAVDGGQAYMG
jgi:NAD(P)-dependent dehydrogenase (short-subunit alcohol dehydrogenase family)